MKTYGVVEYYQDPQAMQTFCVRFFYRLFPQFEFVWFIHALSSLAAATQALSHDDVVLVSVEPKTRLEFGT